MVYGANLVEQNPVGNANNTEGEITGMLRDLVNDRLAESKFKIAEQPKTVENDLAILAHQEFGRMGFISEVR